MHRLSSETPTKGLQNTLKQLDLPAIHSTHRLFLMKAAELYEMNGKYADALKLYERIKDEYPKAPKVHQLINILHG